MVVDTVIRYWVAVVALTEDGTEGIGLSIQDLAAHFYANGGILKYNKSEIPQRAFEVLGGLFDRVGLRKNDRKTVSMAFQTCHMPGQM